MKDWTPLQKVVYYNTYARYSKEHKRRETWEESIGRVIGYLKKRMEPYPAIDESDWKELERLMLDQEIICSMRVLQMAGPTLDRCGVGAYNPVSGDTLVTTREYGDVPIENLAGKQATVLNVNAVWTPATFTGYGEQKVTECIFSPSLGGNAKPSIVRATDNHRWVLTSGEVIPTADLKKGDRVRFVSAKRTVAEDNLDYRLGVIHGLVYGDGTATYKQERLRGYHIRICADTEDILPWFRDYPVAYPPSANGDPVVMLYGDFAKTHALKELPSTDETDEYLIGFMRGWLAADGYVDTSGRPSLCGNLEEISWIRSTSRLGYIIQHTQKLPEVTNFGIRKEENHNIDFFRGSFTEEDFLVTRKRNNFKHLETVYTFRGFGDSSFANVYCAHVPDTNTFTLSRGLVTGNCSFLPLAGPDDLAELLYILMQGTGVGFSVEQYHIDKWPIVHHADCHYTVTEYQIPDTTEGWCDALKAGMTAWIKGWDYKFDYSLIRRKGTKLKTKGGKASGPGPLRELLEFTKKTIRSRAGQRLRPIDIHDIACYCGQIVQVGGVRRAALISLSDIDNVEMREAKGYNFWKDHPQRMMANNSAVYKDQPEIDKWFDYEFGYMQGSGTGERGMFNRFGVLATQLPERRKTVETMGTNPCAEIILRPYQFCNLSAVVTKATDTKDSLVYKLKYATLLGVIQSTITNFNYLRPIWRQNCEDERLLGVDITGQFDNIKLFENINDLKIYRDIVNLTAEEYSTYLGINMPAATTCVKPSGNSAQLLDCSSGVHPRYAPYYIRRIRLGATSTLCKFLIKSNVPYFPETGQENNPLVYVFEFPVAAPGDGPTRDDVCALDQLKHWLNLKLFYTEHNPSCTIYVKEHEWEDVHDWVKKNFSMIGGLTFLPYDGGKYPLAPYEEITQEDYANCVAQFPTLDFAEFLHEDHKDETNTLGELACTGSSCEWS